MIQEALTMFEERGDDAINEINRNVRQWEYMNSIGELRKSEKLFDRITRKYGKSPEEIYLDKEKNQKILHYILWVRDYMCCLSKEDWKLWAEWIIKGRSYTYMSKKYGYELSGLRKKLLKITDKIRDITPLYDKQFGSLYEYLHM